MKLNRFLLGAGLSAAVAGWVMPAVSAPGDDSFILPYPGDETAAVFGTFP